MRLKVLALYGIAEVAGFPVVDGVVDLPEEIASAVLRERPSEFEEVKQFGKHRD